MYDFTASSFSDRHFKSDPAQNALSPAPVITATQIDLLSLTSFIASIIEFHRGGFNAFIDSGLSRVSLAR